MICFMPCFEKKRIPKNNPQNLIAKKSLITKYFTPQTCLMSMPTDLPFITSTHFVSLILYTILNCNPHSTSCL